MDEQAPVLIDLDGDWEFTYRPEAAAGCGDERPTLPEAGCFSARMPVPGYWDDWTFRLQDQGFWSGARFNPDYRPIDFPMGDRPPDASLPYLVGTGWYRKVITAPAEWKGGTATLCVGGVVLQAWVYCNGSLCRHHVGYSTPFSVPLERVLRYGEANEIVIGVANTARDRLGSAIRGYAGRSGGIYRPVVLRIAGSMRIDDFYVHSPDLHELIWSAGIGGAAPGGVAEPAVLAWKILDPETGSVVGEGRRPVDSAHLDWRSGTFGMRSWSDRDPALYRIEVALVSSGRVMDRRVQTFGLRRLAASGTGLTLNGRPVYLRGATEHAYFPLTCTPPLDGRAYRSTVRALRRLGFNWLRFHTWVPSEEYMTVADEEGMMVQVEAPVGSGRAEWIDILKTCRSHASVVVYCCGNEELLDEDKIGSLGETAALCREYAPDALFSPQEALRGVEYCWRKEDLGDGTVEEPFRHNPGRLERLKSFSDLFEPYALGDLSYKSVSGDWRRIDRRLAIYGKPCLTHEAGIQGSYVDLDLEHRYEGTRVGTDLYASVRRGLRRAGLEDRAAVYYRNSCAWMRIIRKHNVENVRKCTRLSGYDFLGAMDYQYHMGGYPCGIMNEFCELKPGESEAEVLQYNGESVLLLDCSNRRNLRSGETLSFDLMVSWFGEECARQSVLRWRVTDDRGVAADSGSFPVGPLRTGFVGSLGAVTVRAPESRRASRLRLRADLSAGSHEITNHWDFWAFPSPGREREESAPIAADSGSLDLIGRAFPRLRLIDSHGAESTGRAVLVLSRLDAAAVDALEKGARVLVLGSDPLPALPTEFQIGRAGRSEGNLATCVEDHPLMRGFPHEGFCDWQFYPLLEGGKAVVFDRLGLPFRPIIEITSSFKRVHRQSALFEVAVGRGRAVVCTMNLGGEDPACAYLVDRMLRYVADTDSAPAPRVAPDRLRMVVAGGGGPQAGEADDVFRTDEAFDANAQLSRGAVSRGAL